MKKIIYILCLLSALYTAHGQELIQNGSFENVASGQSYSTSEGNMNACDQWHTRTQNLSGGSLHSPDWDWFGHATFPNPAIYGPGPVPHTGEKYCNSITGNFELFQQNVSTLSPGYYIISGWIRADSNNVPDPGCPSCQPGAPILASDPGNNKITFVLAQNELAFKSETAPNDATNCVSNYKNFQSNSTLSFDYFFDIQDLYNKQKWIPIELPITFTDDNKSWLGVLYGGNDYDHCVDFVYNETNGNSLNFDDLSLRRASCYCPLEEWIQNTDYNGLGTPLYLSPSGVVQASQAIRAGYNVGIYNPSPGYVTVESGQNITYRAGHSIQLEPGFEAKNGSVFTAVIGDCAYQTGAVSLGNYPIQFVPNYTGSAGYANIFGFFSTGATDYIIKVYGASPSTGLWEEFIYTTGVVPSDGRVLIDNSYWDGMECDQTYDVYITLINCETSHTYHVFTQPLCPDDVEKVRDTVTAGVNMIDSLNQISIEIYPNPVDKALQLSIKGTAPLGTIEVAIVDNKGSQVRNSIQFSSAQTHTIRSIDVSDLASGIYEVQVSCNGNRYMNKIVKSDR